MVACFFFVKQKTAYELRISDWSSDVCSSDLVDGLEHALAALLDLLLAAEHLAVAVVVLLHEGVRQVRRGVVDQVEAQVGAPGRRVRSEEHTSELQSLMRISYADFCLKKNTTPTQIRQPRKQETTRPTT